MATVSELQNDNNTGKTFTAVEICFNFELTSYVKQSRTRFLLKYQMTTLCNPLFMISDAICN